MKSYEQIAESMFEAVLSRQKKRLKGLESVRWDELSRNQKDDWVEAARTAHKEISEVH